MLELYKQGNVGIPLFVFQYKFQFSLCVTNVNSSLKQFKKFNYFFQIKLSLGINNNIILRINISMSKNTESIDITKFLQPFYTINNPNICSENFDQLTRKCLFRINRIIGDLVILQYYFSFAKKIEQAKVQYSTRIQSAA